MTEPNTQPVHGCTIDGQPAMPILVSEHTELVARATQAEAERDRYGRLADDRAEHITRLTADRDGLRARLAEQEAETMRQHEHAQRAEGEMAAARQDAANAYGQRDRLRNRIIALADRWKRNGTLDLARYADIMLAELDDPKPTIPADEQYRFATTWSEYHAGRRAALAGQASTTPAAAVEVRDPCPHCESSPELIPRRLMDAHIADEHPDIRQGTPVPPADRRSRDDDLRALHATLSRIRNIDRTPPQVDPDSDTGRAYTSGWQAALDRVRTELVDLPEQSCSPGAPETEPDNSAEPTSPSPVEAPTCGHCKHPADWHDRYEGCVGPNGIGGLGSGDCPCTRGNPFDFSDTGPVPEEPSSLTAAERLADTACDAYQHPTTPAESGVCGRCGMYDYKHRPLPGYLLTSPEWQPGDGHARCPELWGTPPIQCLFRAGHPPHGCAFDESKPSQEAAPPARGEEPDTVTDPAWLSQQYAAALHDARRNGLGGMTEGQAVDHMADAVMRVRDRHLEQLRQRLTLAEHFHRVSSQGAPAFRPGVNASPCVAGQE